MSTNASQIQEQQESKKINLTAKQLVNWQKKLIDFSRRNQLLYFKPRASLSVEIKEPATEIFRKLVLEGRSLEFKSLVSADMGFAGDMEPFDIDDLEPGLDPDLAALPEEDRPKLNSSALQTDKDDQALSATLGRLHSRAKASLQEQGVKILYLALYFVEWFEVQGNTETDARSPLFLIPVNIERRGLNGSYKVNLIDDEIRINPTMSYKFLRDYGIDLSKLDSLANSSDNLDYIENIEQLEEVVAEIESIVQKESKPEKEWRVVDESSLSLFSFAKLALYKDLENNKEQIVNHPIVRQIAGDLMAMEEFTQGQGDSNYQPEKVFSAKELDKKVDANSAQQILDADSSQQEAICAAKAGQSFVLQGPPGTGKSQTIANIISESLAQGKKVLFVSEKKAALDVVVNRLKESQLHNFCLELHGSQQKKSEVINELRSSWENIKAIALESKRNIFVEDINKVRDELQEVIDELHEIRQPINMSLYEIYGELSRLGMLLDQELEEEDLAVSFTIKNLDRMDVSKLSELDYIFQQLERKSEILNDYDNFIWRNASVAKLSFELENDIKSNFLEFQRILRKLKSYADPISRNYFGREVHTLKEFKWIAEACQLVLESPFPRKDWLAKDSIGRVKELASHAREEHEECRSRREELMAHYSESFFNLDHQSMLVRFETQYQGVMRFFNVNYWKDVSQIKKLSLYNEQKDLNTIIADLEQAAMLDQQTAAIDKESEELQYVLGDFYEKFDTNWEETLTAVRWVQKVLDKFDANIPSALLEVVSSAEKQLADSNAPEEFFDFKENAEELLKAYDLVKFHLQFYKSVFHAPNIDLNKISFDDLVQHLDDLIANVHKIEDWTEFKNLMKKAEDFGFKQLLDGVISRPSPKNSSLLKERFLKKFYELWADKIELENPCMRKFSGHEQRLLIQKFVDLDLKQIEKINNELAKNLSLNWIEYASNPHNQEAIKLIQAELNKKKRHKPIRVLLKEVPELLQTLQPCWMMSPLTVSQLVDSSASVANRLEFDLVIFDEASQIRTEDAISSIYRAKQLILAGDTNQLPPTNFFNFIDEKDDDDYQENHFESVLDECSVFLNNRTLNWHYRSQHESLISFSNYFIYDNSLVTFPSPMLYAEDYGVHFQLVEDGRYEKGARSNRNEAKAVAAAVMQHFSEKPNLSLGVIAFSEAQQDAIERELANLLRKNPDMEQFFNEDNTDAFFVKNLENVQGDERDVIYFSIGYARDSRGTLSHNFGPLNRDGGHRRLNVAITRARRKIKVFSSITGNDIDLTRTSAQGATLLKKYLSYAQQQQHEFDKARGLEKELELDADFKLEEETGLLFESRILQGKENSLGDSIAKALRDQGYKTKLLLGNSDYRVDIVVGTDPDKEEYQLAIETDGPIYQMANTTRDRERLRRQVLENLGWKVVRIYARDWVRNPAQEMQRILAAL